MPTPIYSTASPVRIILTRSQLYCAQVRKRGASDISQSLYSFFPGGPLFVVNSPSFQQNDSISLYLAFFSHATASLYAGFGWSCFRPIASKEAIYSLLLIRKLGTSISLLNSLFIFANMIFWRTSVNHWNVCRQLNQSTCPSRFSSPAALRGELVPQWWVVSQAGLQVFATAHSMAKMSQFENQSGVVLLSLDVTSSLSIAAAVRPWNRRLAALWII